MKRNMEWNKWSDLIRKPLKALRIFSENCAISSQFSPLRLFLSLARSVEKKIGGVRGGKNVNSRELPERRIEKIKMNRGTKFPCLLVLIITFFFL